MSEAIPRHYFLISYNSEKLLTLEADNYHKLQDFCKVFTDKLHDHSITAFDFPFYKDFMLDILHEHSTITGILYDRKVQIPKREIVDPIYKVHNVALDMGFKWDSN